MNPCRQYFCGSIMAALLLAALTRPSAVSAQQKLLTIDDLYDPEKKVGFGGTPVTGLAWLTDTHYLWPKTDDKKRTAEYLKVEAATGRAEAFFDAAKMESALAALPGITRDEAKRLAHLPSYKMNDKRTAVVLTIADDLYYYVFGHDRAIRLTVVPGEEEEATFSPDGAFVAFVRDHNLFSVDILTQRERALTTDGGPQILNGKLDWVYQEEIYGRGTFSGYWWSPDSSRIAFLQLDERPVPEFIVVDHIPYRQKLETTDYPKAGDPNPAVKLGVVRAVGGTPVWIDLDRYVPADTLIVNVAWTPDSGRMTCQVQDREQTWLELNLADRADGSSKTLIRETTRAWVEQHGNPVWLKDRSFLWFSECTGWKHLYHYTADGSLIRPVTSGEWEARTLYGVDEKADWVYFEGTARSPIGADIYRIKLDGTGLQRLSAVAGTHSAKFNPSFSQYIDTWSEALTPPQVRLHRADGGELRVINENRVTALGEYRLSTPQFLTVKTRDGFVMEALMIKPPDFDASRKYPVYQFTYGGPHSQQVRNAWVSRTMYHQLLAERGIIVWICDNRTASGKGAQSTWPLYKNFGELELRDIEDGLTWLRQQPYVDGSRIGIHGWSYGGFMTSYALTHSTSFIMGIAGGTVSDWRDYDTIYTERYMLMPQKNPEGYRKGSPRFAAKNLHGKLLLIHGALDDNVHVQNTLQLAYALQQAGKPFELMLYPTSRHGVTDPALVKHLYSTMLAFTLEMLAPDGAPKATGGTQRQD